MSAGAYITGVGFWTPGVPNPQAWLSGKTDPAEKEPACPLLPPRLARRASVVTRMIGNVFAQAAGPADLSTLPTVVGTTYGELETLMALLRMLWTDGELSPTRFHSSVYNTASGYLSIATSNREFTTTIAAGNDTVPMALLEGLMLLEDGARDLVVIFADECPGSTFISFPVAPLAVAFRLTRDTPDGPFLGRLADVRRGHATADIPAEHRQNPAARALPLLKRVIVNEPGLVGLSDDGDGWLAELLPAGAH